ncbi:MAG TPA: hypothetical protein VFV66_02105 [Nonomuraea sp.]|nr:hypothetical protein [Nonomuraea sp.]
MVKKLCVTGLIAAAAAGATLLAAPAHADTNAGNTSTNSDSAQSGNNFGNIANVNSSGTDVTSVNNVNGNAVTASDGGSVTIDDVLD